MLNMISNLDRQDDKSLSTQVNTTSIVEIETIICGPKPMV